MGVLGGTFDPPHLGHLVLAGEALWQLRLDEVLLVPARQPPHKPAGARWPAEARAELVRRAVAGVPGMRLSRVDLDRSGPSFTADTLELIAAATPGAQLWFLLGADQLEGLPGWRDPGRILAAARLGAVARAGAPARVPPAVAQLVAGRLDVVVMPRVDISSTDVRARMADGRPYAHLVPRAVADALGPGGVVPSAAPLQRKDTERPHSS